MSRTEAFRQGPPEHIVDVPRISAIVPAAEVKFMPSTGGLNHRLSVATPGKEFIPGAGRVGGVQHGSMSWSAETGEVKGILTETPKRRGLATAMLHTARELSELRGYPAPVHSGTQTPEGAAWARRAP